MNVTATEFKHQLGYLLDIAIKEDVYISKNGKIVAKLTSPNKRRVESAKRLFGAIPADFDINAALAERGRV